MTWTRTYSHQFLLSFDLWAAGIFLGVTGITVSTCAGLVRDRKESALKLNGWQISFLRWLEPRLSNAHCEAAKAADKARAEWVCSVLNG